MASTGAGGWSQGTREALAHAERPLARAAEIATSLARRLAREAGAVDCEVRVGQAANHVRHDIDGELFLEARVSATATGRPALKKKGTEPINS